MDEITKTIAVLILWTGGYLAAPMLFTATMGVFRNIMGSGTGFLKGLRGKMSSPGKEARAAGQKMKQERKGMKRSMTEARRRGRISSMRGVLPGKLGGSELDQAYWAAKRAQYNPQTQAGHLRKQADDIVADAAAKNISKEIEMKIKALVGTEYTDEHGVTQRHDTKSARSAVLTATANDVKDRLTKGTISQSEFTGAMSALGDQKAVEQLHGIQDHINSMSPTDKGAAQAGQMWAGMLANSNTYATLSKVTPGLIGAGVGAGVGAEASQLARAKAFADSAPGKLIEADAKAWAEAHKTLSDNAGADADAQKLLDKLLESNKKIASAGEAGAKLQWTP